MRVRVCESFSHAAGFGQASPLLLPPRASGGSRGKRSSKASSSSSGPAENDAGQRNLCALRYNAALNAKPQKITM
jgi:hypothetical protein